MEPKANAQTAINEHAVVIPTGYVAIRARYYGPTNTRGSRIIAWRADDTSYRTDKDADGRKMWYVHSWDHGMDSAENYAAAVAGYVAQRAEAGHDSWRGRWVLAGGRDDYYAVKVGRLASDS